jgi:ssDNA-binding Zn-finger/Zn-ribbon topoisomerase 1
MLSGDSAMYFLGQLQAQTGIKCQRCGAVWYQAEIRRVMTQSEYEAFMAGQGCPECWDKEADRRRKWT